jgi:alpha,alpha-trehalase
MKWISCLTILTLLSLSHAFGQGELITPSARPILVNVPENLERLIDEEDTDGDKRITVEDVPVLKKGRGDKRFWLIACDGKRYEVAGTFCLANLLQELKLAQDAGFVDTEIDLKKIFESPVARISRSIKEIYWDSLTRRIDKKNLGQMLQDEKVTTTGYRYIYVPHSDTAAYAYFSRASKKFSALKVRVERLPAKITPEYVRSLDGKHGLLVLAMKRTPKGEYAAVPFVVPGGRFNEMYGWDSYFIALGLLADGRVDLARGMVDNLVYQINHYGKILNANRTYYLTRSQPPFLTSMALAVYENLPKNNENKAWLKKVVTAAIKEYHGVWMDQAHLTETGLSRYHGSGLGPPPEVEPGHFDAIYMPFALERDLTVREFEKLYKTGQINVPELDKFFVHDRAVRESGHDTTYRWDVGGDRCADFVTVDLNSLLYKIEIDIGSTIEKGFGGKLKLPNGAIETSSTWYNRAQKRRELIQKYLWDEKRGLFFDYDLVRKKRHVYVSATTFYPLWACHPDAPETRLVTPEQAKKIVANAMPLLEMPGGLAASSAYSRGPISTARTARQWDYPNGWPPHQMLAWQGLLNYGFDLEAHRLIYRWIYSIIRNAVDYNGTVTEKLDVVKRSHEVFAEYGNVGTKFAYITKEGFGWMNASYQVGLRILPPNLRHQLDCLVPPEWLFDR